MTPRLRALDYGVRRALEGLRRRPLSTALGTGAVSVALLLVALVHLAANNVGAVASAWGDDVQMVVYLEDNAPRERADAIGNALVQLPAIESVEYVSSADAHARLRDALGEHGEVLDGVEVGLLPASLEVALGDGVRDVAAVSPLVDKLRGIPGVESVELLDDRMLQLSALLGALRYAAFALAFIVAGACVYIVAATVRLGLQGRDRELEVQQLVGATAGFVRGPILLEGALQGAVGAIVAAVLLWILYAVGAAPLTAAFGAAFGHVTLSFLSAGDLALLVFGGATLGLIASAFVAPRPHAAFA